MAAGAAAPGASGYLQAKICERAPAPRKGVAAGGALLPSLWLLYFGDLPKILEAVRRERLAATREVAVSALYDADDGGRGL